MSCRRNHVAWDRRKRQEGIDAVRLRETGETSRQIDDFKLDAACLGSALPREKHGQRGRVELRERCAVHAARASRDTLQTRRERDFRARVG